MFCDPNVLSHLRLKQDILKQHAFVRLPISGEFCTETETTQPKHILTHRNHSIFNTKNKVMIKNNINFKIHG